MDESGETRKREAADIASIERGKRRRCGKDRCKEEADQKVFLEHYCTIVLWA
jgi:hypothetical protein